jgi:hypothetical protein
MGFLYGANHVAQGFAQIPYRIVEAGLGCSHCTIKDFSNLLMALAVLHPQQERQPLSRGELLDCRIEPSADFLSVSQCTNILWRRREMYLLRIHRVLPGTHLVQRYVYGDSANPGAKGRCPSKTMQPCVGSYEAILGYIHGIILVANNAEYRPEDHGLVLSHQYFESRVVASLCLSEKCFLIHVVILTPLDAEEAIRLIRAQPWRGRDLPAILRTHRKSF